MSFLDDVTEGIDWATSIAGQVTAIQHGFNQQGTNPAAPTVQVAVQDNKTTKVLIWVGVGLAAAILLYVVVKK